MNELFEQNIKDVYGEYFKPPNININTVHVVKNDSIINDDTSNDDNINNDIGKTNFEGLTNRIKYLLNSAFEDEWGIFTIEDSVGNDVDEILLPIISCGIVTREASKGKKGVKARQTQIIPDDSDPNYSLIVYRKWFDCNIEFMIFGKTNHEANELSDRFETFMEAYRGFFKDQGVSEMIFSYQDDPRNSIKYKAGIPSVRLMYLVVFEKITTTRVRVTKELLSQINANEYLV